LVERLILLAVVAVVAGLAAAFLQRRPSDAPVRTGWSVPEQLDRADFSDPSTAWLVAVFTSATCDSCTGVLTRALPLASNQVVVQEVEAKRDKDLHDRYRIEAVPMVAIVNAEGVVVEHHLGPVTATHLWGSLAEARSPGSTPKGCGSH